MFQVLFYVLAGFVAGAVCVWCAFAHAILYSDERKAGK